MFHCSAMFSLGKTSKSENRSHVIKISTCHVLRSHWAKAGKKFRVPLFCYKPDFFLCPAVEMWLFAFFWTETFLQSAGSGEVCKVYIELFAILPKNQAQKFIPASTNENRTSCSTLVGGVWYACRTQKLHRILQHNLIYQRSRRTERNGWKRWMRREIQTQRNGILVLVKLLDW